jgi:hypothetical protein
MHGATIKIIKRLVYGAHKFVCVDTQECFKY